MPSVSRSQQRLFQAAEHGATFPKAEQLRASMKGNNFRDFTVGSEAGLPQHVKPARAAKPMHPVMRQRASMVREAHAHLGAAIPGFHQLPGRQKMMMSQHHVNLRLGKVR